MVTEETRSLRIAVTGASRGLGLEFVSRYAEAGHIVFALARQPELPELTALRSRFPESVHLLACDVVSEASVASAAAEVESKVGGLDLLIHNAGIAGQTGAELADLDFDDMARVFAVNAIAPLRVSQALLGSLRAGQDPRIVHITSRMGSIADNNSGGWWAYRMSKAALNMAGRNLMLERLGIATMLLHPGWVQTDMGGAAAPLTVAESVAGMRAVIAGLQLESSGRFLDHTGASVPW